MASSIKLKVILVIFCISFGSATYLPLAKWVFSSDNIENGKIKDLSTYNNEGFVYPNNPIAWSLTCSSLYCDVLPYQGLITSVDGTFTEYGISAWIYFPLNPTDTAEFLGLDFTGWSSPAYAGYITPDKKLEFSAADDNYELQPVFSTPITTGIFYCRQMNIFGMIFCKKFLLDMEHYFSRIYHINFRLLWPKVA